MPDEAGLEPHKPTSLWGIAQTAAANKQHRFRNLYGMLTLKALFNAWRSLNKKAASGVDKVTAEQYEENLLGNLETLLDRKWLKAGLLDTDGTIINPITGTPQGGIVSPILSNVYLHHALDQWFEEEVKPRCSGNIALIRYADDWLCCGSVQAIMVANGCAKTESESCKERHVSLVNAGDTKASTTEEPREGKLHAGICSGGAG